MFEFHKSDRREPHSILLPPLNETLELPSISHASGMLWMEHCTECACPACYKTCDLFDDRGDGHCRRFEYGMVRNDAFRGLYGPAAQITFKKWAKLDASANSRLLPVDAVKKQEVWATRAAQALDSVGGTLFRITGDHRFSKATEVLYARQARRRQRKFQQHLRPDAFLLCVYNPELRPVRVQVQMFIEHRYQEISGKVMPFRTEFVLRPGYSTHEIPARVFDHLISSGFPFYISLIPAEEQQITLVFLIANLVKYAIQAQGDSAALKPIKCVVFDLDNTVWDGTLAETDHVVIKEAALPLLKELDERGILLSIASKNDGPAAIEQLKALGIADLFVCPQIGWQPKSQSLRLIAQQLNIGLDSIAFVDDSEFELDEVRRSVPEVTTFHADLLAALSAMPALKGSNSEEARNRRGYYQEAIVRDQKFAEAGTGYAAFLAECRIRMNVARYSTEQFERISELVQRTNQLNFSGHHYTRAELAEMLADPDRGSYVIGCEDRYGSYGLVGFCLTRQLADSIVVEDFMLSCRVQAKFIEKAFFANLRTNGGRELPRDLQVRFRQTERNTPARNVLRDLGFSEHDGNVDLRADVPLACDFIDTTWPYNTETAPAPCIAPG